ncbi:MAG: NAD-dependent epimerase/dehydratase family protein [Candidatus Dormibacteria bacterium]
MPRRVLVTGVSRFWGAELAKRLEADVDIEQIVGIDAESPRRNLARTDVVRADLRHNLVGRLVRGLGIDTVVHAGLIVDPQQAGPRTVHESNVIGTMNLLAACSGDDSPVRTLIVKSSTAVYGSEPDDPSFWTEDMRPVAPARDGFTRDLAEAESYVREFALRNPRACVTTLRFGNVLGEVHDSPFARLFDLPVIPTVLGFDPRLQFLDEDDAVDALLHALRSRRPGVYNVAGPGVVVLSQAVAVMGAVSAPLIPFLGGTHVLRALERSGLVDFPAEFARLLKYGRVVDTTKLRVDLGFTPRRTTLDTVKEYARRRRARGVTTPLVSPSPAQLEAFLASRGRRATVAATSRRRSPTRATGQPRRASARPGGSLPPVS